MLALIPKSCIALAITLCLGGLSCRSSENLVEKAEVTPARVEGDKATTAPSRFKAWEAPSLTEAPRDTAKDHAVELFLTKSAQIYGTTFVIDSVVRNDNHYSITAYRPDRPNARLMFGGSLNGLVFDDGRVLLNGVNTHLWEKSRNR